MPIVQWLRQVLDAGETPHLLSYTTSVVRLAEAAQAAGVDLAGAELTFGGEPVTEPRLLVIRRSGARAVPRYAMVEAGLLAEGWVLRVERRPPLPTASGKILHLHRERRPGPEGRETQAP